MMLGLDNDLGHLKKNKALSPVTGIRYLFLTWGIDYNRFNELPLPYVFEMFYAHIHVKEQEAEALKKGKKIKK